MKDGPGSVPVNALAPTRAGQTFVRGADVPWEDTASGVRRQILGHGPDLMMVRVDFEGGATGSLHRHPHRQVTFVARGRFEVTVDGLTALLTPGDCFYVATDLEHGVRAIDEGGGTLVDVFTPTRMAVTAPAAT